VRHRRQGGGDKTGHDRGPEALSPEGVLLFIRERIRRPVSFRELVARMGLGRSEARALKRILRTLIRKGLVIHTRKGQYGPSEELNRVTGVFSAHRDGYGFVTPDRPGERDIFIPARHTLGAFEGDRVEIQVERWGRREGKVVRILTPGRRTVAGRIEQGRGGMLFVPTDARIGPAVVTLPRDRQYRAGDRVLADLNRRRTRGGMETEARNVRAIEEPSCPREDIDLLAVEAGLPETFPAKVLEDARRAAVETARRRRVTGTRGRQDLRGLFTVTIDGSDARDFDDAVSIAEEHDGSFRLWVHIADVAEYVPVDSAVDREARARGTSVYFPDRVIPMLPPALSNGACSLNPGEDRLTVTVEMSVHRDGRIRECRFYPSRIRSRRRMTYQEVSALLDGDTPDFDVPAETFPAMERLCRVLRNQRLLRGSLDFDLPEARIVLDRRGFPVEIVQGERTAAHRIIEEFMIAANEAVARFLHSHDGPVPYRIHETPDDERIAEVRDACRALGVRWPRNRSLQNTLTHVLGELEGTRLGPFVHNLVLRAMKRARYSPENVGHFGLASDCYCHFTSPIRRYPDLMTHRVLKTVLAGNRGGPAITRAKEELPDLTAACSRLERLAEDTERKAVDVMRMWYMKGRVGEDFDAVITGAGPKGLWIRLDSVFIESFLPVSTLGDDYYRFDGLDLRGQRSGRRFTVGTTLRVRLDGIDVEERRLTFYPV